jgi:hypothetical protein
MAVVFDDDPHALATMQATDRKINLPRIDA